MACGMVCPRSLPTARADSLLLTRLRPFVQTKLVVELGLRSNVEIALTLVDDAQSLGLTDAELGLGDELHDDVLIGFRSESHCFSR